MPAELPRCRDCGGALQRVESMPGHLVCGSGHLFTEKDVLDQQGQSQGTEIERVGKPKPGGSSQS